MHKYRKTAEYCTRIVTGGLSDEEIAEATIDLEIAHAIRNAREAKELSKRQLAKYLGITPTLLSRWESGKLNFSIHTLMRVASALDCEFVCPIRFPDTSLYKKEG